MAKKEPGQDINIQRDNIDHIYMVETIKGLLAPFFWFIFFAKKMNHPAKHNL